MLCLKQFLFLILDFKIFGDIWRGWGTLYNSWSLSLTQTYIHTPFLLQWKHLIYLQLKKYNIYCDIYGNKIHLLKQRWTIIHKIIWFLKGLHDIIDLGFLNFSCWNNIYWWLNLLIHDEMLYMYDLTCIWKLFAYIWLFLF